MNTASKRFRILLICFAVIGSVFAASAPASARVVEVLWSPDDENAPLRTMAQAREAGFRRAVFAESLALLPGVLSEPRQELLRQYLLPKAGGYVLSYSETTAIAPEGVSASEPAVIPESGQPPVMPPLGQQQTEEGAEAESAPEVRILRLDVTVNRAGLKRTLQRMGVYYTVNSRRSYDLSLLGDASGAWEELGRLQMFSGLSVQRNADPRMEIEAVWVESTPQDDAKKKSAKPEEEGPVLQWKGRLTLGGEFWIANGADLAEVWFDLWGRFFSRPGAEAGVVDETSLAVRGWYAADGVKAFDAELASWEGIVEGATLKRVVMLPGGIGAVWSVKTLSSRLLAEQLDAMLPGRGLTWEFAEDLTPEGQ